MPDKPLPTSEGDREVYIENLFAKVPPEQLTLGLSAGDMVRLEAAAANFDYIRSVAAQVTDTKDAFFDWKNSMFNGPLDGTFNPPVFPVVVLPELGAPGIIPWIRQLVQRIKNSPNYTQQMGEDFGFITSDPASIVPADIVPTITLKALTFGRVEIKFSKQGLDGIRIDWRPKGEQDWQLADKYTSSPAIHEAPSPEGKPEAREYRGILLKKNEAVSQFSDIVSVTTTP